MLKAALSIEFYELLSIFQIMYRKTKSFDFFPNFVLWNVFPTVYLHAFLNQDTQKNLMLCSFYRFIVCYVFLFFVSHCFWLFLRYTFYNPWHRLFFFFLIDHVDILNHSWKLFINYDEQKSIFSIKKIRKRKQPTVMNSLQIKTRHSVSRLKRTQMKSCFIARSVQLLLGIVYRWVITSGCNYISCIW